MQFKSCDGVLVPVPARAVKHIALLRENVDLAADESDDPLDVPHPLTTAVLTQIVDLCSRFDESPFCVCKPITHAAYAALPQYAHEFMKPLISADERPTPVLYDVMAGANFLGAQPVLELTCASVATLILCKQACDACSLFE
jgi:hypothetical protein